MNFLTYFNPIQETEALPYAVVGGLDRPAHPHPLPRAGLRDDLLLLLPARGPRQPPQARRLPLPHPSNPRNI